jgi:hypothetical protein
LYLFVKTHFYMPDKMTNNIISLSVICLKMNKLLTFIFILIEVFNFFFVCHAEASLILLIAHVAFLINSLFSTKYFYVSLVFSGGKRLKILKSFLWRILLRIESTCEKGRCVKIISIYKCLTWWYNYYTCGIIGV